MSSISHHLPSSVLTFSRSHHKYPKSRNSQKLRTKTNFKCYNTNSSQWEPAPISYAPDNEDTFPTQSSNNIFETLNSPKFEPSVTKTEHAEKRLQYLRTPLWLLGPALLLLTGVVPTLWLPVSSIFLGPNIASLLSLTGLDCIFNLGAFLFLLMADSTARQDENNRACNSGPPGSYRFWNLFANVVGFIIPLLVFFGLQRGSQLGFISFAVILGPYFLLLAVQTVTEVLTWHWRSPVWLVTPVVYEAYRLLQLMRGLRLGDELGVPGWTVHTVRGLVCGWVLVLGVQLMRVAWYAGFTAFAYQQQNQSDAFGDG
ncbi:hypothetical protein PHJA_001641900 [Phtheirospermum japonicum]|uniref:Transmembrane protein n=1 Tax=Phtheirospermum japonicum TaxID=374723 RepID=A0A830CIM3_9LAMI|nr:hypothetical protein PHJA_001641900 [Phtheirospermum japonicum]